MFGLVTVDGEALPQWHPWVAQIVRDIAMLGVCDEVSDEWVRPAVAQPVSLFADPEMAQQFVRIDCNEIRVRWHGRLQAEGREPEPALTLRPEQAAGYCCEALLPCGSVCVEAVCHQARTTHSPAACQDRRYAWCHCYGGPCMHQLVPLVYVDLHFGCRDTQPYPPCLSCWTLCA